MTTQRTFLIDGAAERFALPPAPEPPPAPATIERLQRTQMHELQRRQPKLVAEFIRRALAAKEGGVRRKGAKGFLEDMREAGFKANGKGFSLNNNLTPTLARLAMAVEPELEGYFETR